LFLSFAFKKTGIAGFLIKNARQARSYPLFLAWFCKRA
jgi:hypothetical protein